MAETMARARGKRAAKKHVNCKTVVRRLLTLIAALVLLCITAYFINGYLDKTRYKLVYPDEIRAYAGEFGIDPYLVASMIHCESGNRQEVVSPKGAVGLMQIMPDTGAWIAEKLEMTDYTEAALLSPETNIRFGCWYIDYLLEKYNQNVALTVAAYNAGPGNVDKWLENPEHSKNGQLVSIPFGETARYVENVAAVKCKYKELYENELA